jgi:tetratricopeptide (TPR) repeat protein
VKIDDKSSVEERGSIQEELGKTIDDCEPTRSSILGPRSSVLDPRSSFFKLVASLGIQAAEALDHAHQLGVVHRDIKPANLLLEIVPGVETLRGVPGAFPTGIRLWMTDFGLARMASPGGGEGGNLTLTGDLVGTIRYMSPEQTQGRPGGVDHSTDIYSLGVTLYELLTLAPAFPSGDRHELLTQIVFEEPTKPRRLNPAIPPELETIVLKSMAKSPSERYGTARELAADLERFLKDEPIRARRPTSIQRARKWARRHRPTVWSAVAALLVTLAGLAGSVGWVMRDRAAGRAKMVADIEAAAKDAQRFQVQGKFPEAQAAAIRAKDLLKGGHWPDLDERVHDLLSGGRLAARLEEIRLLQAADVHAKENRFAQERAVPEYRQAFKEYGLEMSTVTPEEAAALLQGRSPAIHTASVVGLEDWLELTRQSNGMEVKWLEEVLSLADSDPWRKSLRGARIGRDRQALERLAREVDVSAQPPQVLILLDRALRGCSAKEGAIALLKRAQEAFPGDFWINHDLGVALQECKPPQYEEAIRFLTAAEALRPQSPGVRLSLGLALSKNGRFNEAIIAFRQAIELKPDYAAAHVNLGGVYMEEGQLDQALAVYHHAAEVIPDDLEVRWNLGVVQAGMGHVEEALAAYEQILALKPDFIETHFDPATQLSLKSWHDQAVAISRESAGRKPKNAVIQGSPTKETQKDER